MRTLAEMARSSENRLKIAYWNNYCWQLMRGGGDLVASYGMAQQAAGTPQQVLDVLKSAVAIGTTSDANWANSLTAYKYLSDGFVEALRNVGVFDYLLANGMRRLPMRTRVIATTSSASASIVSETKPKPITRLTFSGDTLSEIKASAIIVLNDELIQLAVPAMQLIGRELQNAVALTTDTQFFSIVLNGISAIPSSGITSLDAILDFQALLAAISTGATSTVYFAVTPTIAKQLSMKATTHGELQFPEMSPTGGSVGKIPVLVSDALSAGQIVCIDASGIAGGSDNVLLDSTQQASIQMDPAPDDPTSASSVLTSLWQTNMKALRAERYFGVTRIRSSAVALLSGADYHNYAGSGS